MKALIAGGSIVAHHSCTEPTDVEIFEHAEEIRELGVGFNILLSNAVKALAELGLLATLRCGASTTITTHSSGIVAHSYCRDHSC